MTRSDVLSFEQLTLGVQRHGQACEVLRDVSFSVAPGRVLGLVGESGAGKSMIGRVLAGHAPDGFEVTRGRIVFEGADLLTMPVAARRRLLGRRIAYIPQEPLTALNPVMTIGQTFSEHLDILGIAPAARQATMLARLEAVHLPQPAELVNRYPHQLSGGQCQRVLIAMAFAAKPALIVADEPTTALDVVSQATVLRLLAEQREAHGTAVLLITHDLRMAAHVCDDIAVLYAGEPVEVGPAHAVLSHPRHPYTLALQKATPEVSGQMVMLPVLKGQMPGISALAGLAGCRFSARCETRDEACHASSSPLREAAPGHWVRCTAACEPRALPPAIPVPRMSGPATQAAGDTPLVELVDVSLRYTSRRGLFGQRAVHNDAVKHLSLRISPGEFVGIVGESGSGKSSVARLIIGAQKPTGGRVLIEGEDSATATPEQAARHRERVQMIFQDPHSALNPRRTIAQLLTQALEVDLGSGRPTSHDFHRRASELLGDVGLPPDALPRFPSQLSGGQKQRVNIGRALCTMPRLIVADEIVSGLDVSVQAQILNLLLELGQRHGIGLLLISHDLSVVRYLCSRVLVMHRGEVVEQGPTAGVFENPQHAYTRLLLASVPPSDLSVPWPPLVKAA